MTSYQVYLTIALGSSYTCTVLQLRKCFAKYHLVIFVSNIIIFIEFFTFLHEF